MSQLDKWEKENQVFSLSTDFLAQKFLTMSEADFNKLVTKVKEARDAEKSKKEAMNFAKELSKDVIIPLLINSAKK